MLQYATVTDVTFRIHFLHSFYTSKHTQSSKPRFISKKKFKTERCARETTHGHRGHAHTRRPTLCKVNRQRDRRQTGTGADQRRKASSGLGAVLFRSVAGARALVPREPRCWVGFGSLTVRRSVGGAVRSGETSRGERSVPPPGRKGPRPRDEQQYGTGRAEVVERTAKRQQQ